jgi:hypothetical protein
MSQRAFGEVWDAVQQQIQESPGLEAKTLFEWLQREYPGTVQRRPDPNSETANQIMAGDRGTRAGGLLRPETRAGAAVRV